MGKTESKFEFDHDPDVAGFKELVNLFADHISGKPSYDEFVAKWKEVPPGTKIEFRKFMNNFREFTKEFFEDVKS